MISGIKEKGESLKDIDWNSQKSRLNIPTKATAHILSDTKQMLLSVEDNLLHSEFLSILKEMLSNSLSSYISYYKEISIETKHGATKFKLTIVI